MKTLTTLSLLCVSLTAAAWQVLPGARSQAPVKDEPEIRFVQAAPAKPAAPVATRSAPTLAATPSALQVALQAGDLCATAREVDAADHSQAEIVQAVLGAISPSPALLEAFSKNGALYGPAEATAKSKLVSTQFLRALHLGGLLYTQPGGVDRKAAREAFLELEKKDPGNAIYPYFRLSVEDRLGLGNEVLVATANDLAAASFLDDPTLALNRELVEASWQSPANRKALEGRSIEDMISYYSSVSVIRRLVKSGDFRDEKKIAQVLTAPGLRATRSRQEHDFNDMLYSMGRSLDPEAYPSSGTLEKERGFEGRRIYGPSIWNGKDCNPGPYEDFFYEARSSR